MSAAVVGSVGLVFSHGVSDGNRVTTMKAPLARRRRVGAQLVGASQKVVDVAINIVGGMLNWTSGLMLSGLTLATMFLAWEGASESGPQ